MIVYDVTLPYLKINTLTEEDAKEYSEGHKLYKEHFQGHEVKWISLEVRRDYKATIEYYIPSVDNDMIKKLNRQRKKFSYI